jgi:hypothetical protein
MTNKELIEKLQKLPQDAEVWLEYYDYGNHFARPVVAATNLIDENTIVIE